MSKGDLIQVVEACYALDRSGTEWMQGVVDAVANAVGADEGVIGYQVIRDERGFGITDIAHTGFDSPKLPEQIGAMARLLDRSRRGELGAIEQLPAKLTSQMLARGMDEPAPRLFHSEHRRVAPEWLYKLGTPAEDELVILNRHVEVRGATPIVAGFRRRPALTWRQREVYQMLSAHIRAGMRLRRRLPRAPDGVDAPEDGAVLTPSGRLLHVAPSLEQRRDAHGELKTRTKAVDHARNNASGRGFDAVEVWEGLVDGTWSLVEQFDTDGKRFILAIRNDEAVRDPRGLTPMEARVAAVAARGFSNKLVAYHLGLKEGTASSLLVRAMRKLGIRRRVDLLRLLGDVARQE